MLLFLCQYRNGATGMGNVFSPFLFLVPLDGIVLSSEKTMITTSHLYKYGLTQKGGREGIGDFLF